MYDFSAYSYDGEILYTALSDLDAGVLFDEQRASFIDAVTYRGIALGDDILTALEHMQLPAQALFVDSSTLVETALPYDIATVVEHPNDRYWIVLYFDYEFNVLDVTEVFPLTEKVDAQWMVDITFENGAMIQYSARYIIYANQDPNNI